MFVDRLSYLRVVKDTIGMIAESEKEVEYAAREVEYLIRWVRNRKTFFLIDVLFEYSNEFMTFVEK